jgi:hypothetical protein
MERDKGNSQEDQARSVCACEIDVICGDCRRDQERRRHERNSTRRARYDAYRSCGMVRTPYGWE